MDAQILTTIQAYISLDHSQLTFLMDVIKMLRILRMLWEWSRKFMPDYLPKDQRDALVIIRYDVDRFIEKKVIDKLVFAQLITPKHGGGWMLTSTGREYVRRIK